MEKKKILLIEDEEDIRTIITFAFEQDYHIETAADGDAGLEKTRSFKPDLVILDLNMPVMSGFEYLQTVRKYPEFSAMPVLVLTASTDPKDIADAIELGVTDYMVKPLDLDMLIQKVEVFIE